MAALFEFSPVFEHNGAVVLSPNGLLSCKSMGSHCVVMHVVETRTVGTFACEGQIHTLSFAPNSRLVMATCLKAKTIHIFDIENPEWDCTIREGALGLRQAQWAPDSVHIITISDFSIRLTIWSLLNRSGRYIDAPKSIACCAFTHDGKFACFVVRSECKDYALIIDCSTWEEVNRFQLASENCTKIKFSSVDHIFMVVDHPLQYGVYFYDLNGVQQGGYRAYENALGVRNAVWSPCGQLIAVGSCDQKIRIVNALSFQIVATLEHLSPVPVSENCVQYDQTKESVGLSAVALPHTRVYEAFQSDKYIELDMGPVVAKDASYCGINRIAWSPSSKLLASVNDSCPNYIWIWSIETLELLVVVKGLHNVGSFSWIPNCEGEERLLLVSGQPIITEVSLSGIKAHRIQAPTNCVKLLCSTSSKSIIVASDTHLHFGYFH
ncbi:hypothetical protein PCE1_004945 [Barthelona sp. PCE]